MTGEYIERRGLTFGQAEGMEPMPRQLALGEISTELRVLIAAILHEALDNATTYAGYLTGSWKDILFDLHTQHLHKFPDEFKKTRPDQKKELLAFIKNEGYAAVLGVVQFILQHSKSTSNIEHKISWALTKARAAYRVIDGGLLVPIASEAEGQAVLTAFAELNAAEFNGARKHLSEASKLLTAGSWSDSVRESIHAVESVAKVLEPSQETLAPALNALAKAGHIHPALKEGMAKLYGYTSDEKGIRHALLEGGDAKVDETDALYMFGACASFVTYLIGKGRSTDLIN